MKTAAPQANISLVGVLNLNMYVTQSNHSTLSLSRLTLSYLTDASVHFYCRPYFELKRKYDSILEVFTVLFILLHTYFITLEYRIHDFQMSDGRHKYRARSTRYETRTPSPIAH